MVLQKQTVMEGLNLQKENFKFVRYGKGGIKVSGSERKRPNQPGSVEDWVREGSWGTTQQDKI